MATESESDSFDVASYIQTGFSKLRHDDIGTDFEVVVGDRSFRCQKMLLAAMSDYFLGMFRSGMRETAEGKAVIPDVLPEMFESILDLIYDESGEISRALSQKSIGEMEEYMRLACRLQMTFLKDFCFLYFKNNLDVHNCIQIWQLARQLEMKGIQTCAWKYMLSHFIDLTKDETLMTLTFEDFKTLIGSKHLPVQKEELVCDTILSWVTFEETREDKLNMLLKCISLTQVKNRYLFEVLSLHPLCRKDDEVTETIKLAAKYKFHKDQHGNITVKLRTCTELEQLPVLLVSKRTGYSMLGHRRNQHGFARLQKPIDELGELYACCVYGSSFYLTGGTPRPQKHFRYNGKTGIWETKRKMLIPLTQHTMTAQDEYLYVFGGCDSANINGTIIAYSIETNSWNFVGELTVPVYRASSASLDGKIYILGGMTSSGNVGNPTASDSVQVFDATTKLCTIFCHLPDPCSFSRAVCDTNNIFLVTTTGAIVKLKSSNTEPEIIARIPDFNRCNFGAVLHDSVISVYGGVLVDDNSQRCDEIYEVDTKCLNVSHDFSFSEPREIYESLHLVVSSRRFIVSPDRRCTLLKRESCI